MITLNSNQEKICQEAINWFRNSSEQVFEIAGPAGTGKSVLIGEILRRLGLRQDQYMSMAYTGQASIVMRTRGFKTAKSIHSSLYELVEMPDYDNINNAFGTPKKKYTFQLMSRTMLPESICLFFIDEGYMVPNNMVKDILSFGIKVIVAGDTNQLPPIGDKPGFLINSGVHRLTQLMRQAENDPIVYLAQRAIQGLAIHSGLYGNQVLVIDDTDFRPEMVGYADCICCGTNKTRDNLNTRIRELAGFHTITPNYGERIICRNNNWNIQKDGIALCNGLSGTVVSQVQPSSFAGRTFFIDFLPDLLYEPFDQVQVNYDYFAAPYEEKIEMKDYQKRRWMEGEFFEFAYALTTHLCQGSEYNKGIYIEEFLRPQIQNQLNYTGITRFKKSLIYIKKTTKYITIPDINYG